MNLSKEVFVEFEKYNKLRDIYYKSLVYLESSKDIKIEENDYIDKKIINKLVLMKHNKKVFIKINNIELIFEFFDKHKINKKYFTFLFNLTCFLIYYLNIKSKSEEKKILTINLYNYKGKKKIPKNNSNVEKIHVNSGYTTYYFHDNKANILIYRNEEVCKVLIHELIHALRLDLDVELHNKEIDSLFCSKSSIKINETYTDTLACILNTILYSLFSLDNDNIKDFQDILKINFREENNFIKCQAYKLLLINKYIFDKNKIICEKMNDEETNAIAYYILKALLFSKFFLFKEKNKIDEFILNKIKKTNWNTFGKKEYNMFLNKDTFKMSNLDIIELFNKNKNYIKIKQKYSLYQIWQEVKK